MPTTLPAAALYEQELARIKADPIAFLHEALEASGRLEQFTMTFQRQERLGLLKELQPVETMFVEYRDEPFSVRFTWTDADSEFRQCVYVDGQNDGKVLLLPRKGLLGAKPIVQSYPPQYAVLFGKTRNPITDFGPRRMMERTLDRIEKAAPFGGVKIAVRDEESEIGPGRERCFSLEIRYPPGDEYACKLQDLYISVRWRIPYGTYLWLTETDERTGDTLDAMYTYAKIRESGSMTDAHFVIERDGKTQSKSASKGRAAQAASE